MSNDGYVRLTVTHPLDCVLGVVQSGNTVSFVLNESADSVVVNFGNGASQTLTGEAGNKSFSLTGTTQYSIVVTKNAGGCGGRAGWLRPGRRLRLEVVSELEICNGRRGGGKA